MWPNVKSKNTDIEKADKIKVFAILNNINTKSLIISKNDVKTIKIPQ